MNKEELMALFGTDDISVIRSKKESSEAHLRAATLAPRNISVTRDECSALCKKIGYTYQENDESRIFELTFTDETVDRYGDIVVARGGNFKNYYPKNPVILGFHDSRTFPIGQCLKLSYNKEKNSVVGWVLIIQKNIDPTGTSEVFYQMLKAGVLKAGSIGFMPIKYHRPTEQECEERGMPAYGIVFDEWEMLEFSICSVPANPNALQNSLAKGVLSREQVRSFIDTLKEKSVEISAPWENLYKQITSGEDIEFKEVDEESATETGTETEERTTADAVITIKASDLGALVREQVAAALKENAGGNVEALIPEVIKAGAVLSKKNRTMLEGTLEKLKEAVAALDELLESTSPSDDDDDDEEGDESEEGKSAPIPYEKSTNENDVYASLANELKNV